MSPDHPSRIIILWTMPLLNSVLPLGSDPCCAPVFVVGCGRSGTTLVRLILNRNAQLSVFGESGVFFRTRRYAALKNPRAMRRFLADWRSVCAESLPSTDVLDSPLLQDELRNAPTYTAAVSAIMAHIARSENKTLWGEKTPAHVMRLELIFRAYPNARVVHVTRDPRAVVASGITQLGEGPLNANNVYAAARYWIRCESEFDKFAQRFPSQTALLRYEDLIAAPEVAVKKICEFLHIEFDSRMLEFATSAQAYAPKERGDVLHFHTGLLRNINSDAVEKWRGQLDGRLTGLIEETTGEWMRRRGYRAEVVSSVSWKTHLTTRLSWAEREARRILYRKALDLFWGARAVVTG